MFYYSSSLLYTYLKRRCSRSGVLYMKNRRISWLGLLKFLASLMIVWCHTSKIRNGEEYNFKYTYLLVEFFFIVSGYFVYKHFQKETFRKLSMDNAAKESLKYTFKKFLGYLPYIFISVLAMTVLSIVHNNPTSVGALINLLKVTPFEILFLSSQTGLRLSPIWYISSLFIVTPIFSLLAQKLPKYLNYLISMLLVIVIYGNYFDNMDKFFGIDCLIRAFVGMSLGTIVYGAADYIGKINFKKYQRVLISTLEFVFGFSALALMYPASVDFVQGKPTEALIILLMAASLTLLLSSQTITSKINLKFFDLLEKISLPIYITHWVVLYFLQHFLSNRPECQKIFILYGITIAVSVSLYAIIELHKAKSYIKSIQYSKVLNEKE